MANENKETAFNKSSRKVEALMNEAGLTSREYRAICETLGREPNDLELSLYGAMWSEHCSYKHSKALLKLLPGQGDCVIQGPGENAGVVDIGDGWAVAFKIESHNHPSAVEPFQGAATGVGGILRDVFTMGARPVAVLNSLRFGPIEDPRTKFLLNGVVAGISHYGNCVGVPTVGGETYFAESYTENPLVNAMAVGIMRKENLTRARASLEGCPVMVVGTPTGRDGINGASFASANLSDETAEDRPAVQVGDPFKEKLLLEACLELLSKDLVVGIQDMGAAGLLSSSCEMAARGGKGMEINLDLVPLREKGMTPKEIMLSESQERMLVVPRPGSEEKVRKIFQKWGLEAAVIGRVTADKNLILLWHGEIVARVPAGSLADGVPAVEQELSSEKVKSAANEDNGPLFPKLPEDWNRTLLKLLASPNLASKRYIYEQYDYMVQNNTVVLPGGDASVLRIPGTQKGIALTTDCNNRYCALDPRQGAKIAVAEAARNIVASGGWPLAITDGLNFGSPEDDQVYNQFREVIYGLREACERLNTPVVSGNVSFYNQTERGAIDPTPIIGMVGLLENVEKYQTIGFKAPDECIILIGENKGELGGSEYLEWIHDIRRGPVPQIDWDMALKINNFIYNKKVLFTAVHDLSEGGLAIALIEMALAGGMGFKVRLDSILKEEQNLRTDALLFGEDQSRFLVTLTEENLQIFRKLAEKNKIPYHVIGRTKESPRVVIQHLIDLTLDEIKGIYEEALPCYLEQ